MGLKRSQADNLLKVIIWGSIAKNMVKHISLKKKKYIGVPGWLSQLSIWLLILAQVMISESWDWALSQTLCSAWSLLEILSPSLFPSMPLSLFELLWAHSISKRQINLKKRREKIHNKNNLCQKSNLTVSTRANYLKHYNMQNLKAIYALRITGKWISFPILTLEAVFQLKSINKIPDLSFS